MVAPVVFLTGARLAQTVAKYLAGFFPCASAPVGIALQAIPQTGANWRKVQKPNWQLAQN
jgi:hypothetical protein